MEKSLITTIQEKSQSQSQSAQEVFNSLCETFGYVVNKDGHYTTVLDTTLNVVLPTEEANYGKHFLNKYNGKKIISFKDWVRVSKGAKEEDPAIDSLEHTALGMKYMFLLLNRLGWEKTDKNGNTTWHLSGPDASSILQLGLLNYKGKTARYNGVFRKFVWKAPLNKKSEFLGWEKFMRPNNDLFYAMLNCSRFLALYGTFGKEAQSQALEKEGLTVDDLPRK